MQEDFIWIVLVGVLVLLAMLTDAGSRRIGVSSLVGYILLGVLLHTVDQRLGLIGEAGDNVLHFLGQMGVVILLFHVGLESRPRALMHELPRASLVGVSNLAVAGLAGYAAARFWLGLELVPSLVAGTALTATSIGVSVAVWEEHGAVDSPSGRLLLDVAELDDIGGVVLMGLLLAIVPVLEEGGGQLWSVLGGAAWNYAWKFVLFAAGCVLFSLYLAHRVLAWSERAQPDTGAMLALLGTGAVIAALAGWLGFSLAIGALFAGLVFSRDPEAVRSEVAFDHLYVFFVPFFFIDIGRDVELQSLLESWDWGLVLLLAAVVGKIVGTGVSAWPMMGGSRAMLLAASMVPRAEITMVVAQQGLRMEIISTELYSALVVVAAATSLVAPMVLRPLLGRVELAKSGSK